MSDHGFRLEPNWVRLDRFNANGKWKYTHEVKMLNEWWDHWDLFAAVENAMERAEIGLEDGWVAVVLEPYHKNSYPVIIKGPFPR